MFIGDGNCNFITNIDSKEMMNITTRIATLEDLELLLEFEQGVIEFERKYDSTLKTDHTNYYNIPLLIESPNIQMIIAETTNQIVGCGYARIEDAKVYLQHQKHAYLGFMFVKPDFRGKGINKIVIDTLKKWADSKGIFELRLDVYFKNIGAIKAYQKANFIEHMIEMRMKID